jgi:cellulose synthase/poly-beta-1,6-N-acetylglucosamine synthase-like glycosyltransferase
MHTVEAMWAPSLVIALAYLSIVATAAIGAALRVGGRREDTVDHNDALSLSRFTIPVSVIVPASHDCGRLSHTVAALLGLHYPEFEVIVVVDGVAATALETFSREWQLEAREFFYRQTIDTSPVRRIYRSARDARLVVVDKASNGYADSTPTRYCASCRRPFAIRRWCSERAITSSRVAGSSAWRRRAR